MYYLLKKAPGYGVTVLLQSNNKKMIMDQLRLMLGNELIENDPTAMQFIDPLTHVEYKIEEKDTPLSLP